MNATTLSVVISALVLSGCGGEPDRAIPEAAGDTRLPGAQDAQHEAEPVKPRAASAATKVLVFDSGLNMPMGIATIPAGWKLYHDIRTDTSTAAYSRYLLDISGPEGMMVRGLGMTQYNHMAGQNFAGTVESMVRPALQGIDGLNFGRFELDRPRMETPAYQEQIQGARAKGMGLEAVRMDFTGSAGGRAIAGRVEIDHSLFFDGGQQFGGAVVVAVLLAGPGQVDDVAAISGIIGRTFQPNPAYDGARARVIDAASARGAAEHNQRMAQNQAQFESHQQMMQGRYQSAYSQNQQWLQNFTSSGSGSGAGDAYTSHDKFIDMLGETTSFEDSATGFRNRQDGEFQQWATDGQGHYIGSNDASFDPNALGGTWRKAEPVR